MVTWGDSNNYKNLNSAEIYKSEIYGNIFNASVEKTGFGKLDIENNTQNVTIENLSSFNSIGKDIYYINDDGIFMASIDGENQVKLMDIAVVLYPMQIMQMKIFMRIMQI